MGCLIEGAPGNVDINICVGCGGCLGDLECDVLVLAAVVLIFTIGLVDKVTELDKDTISVDVDKLAVTADAGTDNSIGCVTTAKGMGGDVEDILLVNSIGLLLSICWGFSITIV